MSTDTTRAAMQAALEWLKKLPDTDPLWPYFVNGRFRADMDDAIAAIEAAIEAAQPQQAEASPATLTERDHFDLALWHKKLGELADAYYEAGRTHPARQRARAALMLHALDCATGWRARSAKPQQAEPVTVEAVAEVVRTEDGLDLSWLVEGGICAMEDGVVLLMSHRPITDDFGHGEVYTAPPAHSAKPQQAEPVKLHENEQYILQMAGISTAAPSVVPGVGQQ